MSEKKRMIATAGVVSAIAMAGVLGTAPTASAASIPTVEAQATYVYLYEHDNFGGGSFRTTSSDSNLTNNCWSTGGGCRSVNDNASSMKNQKASAASYYRDASYAGPSYYAQPKSSDKDLTDNGFDNRISSIRIW